MISTALTLINLHPRRAVPSQTLRNHPIAPSLHGHKYVNWHCRDSNSEDLHDKVEAPVNHKDIWGSVPRFLQGYSSTFDPRFQLDEARGKYQFSEMAGLPGTPLRAARFSK